ncbi:beta-ketoacyl synthase N-terminal-like domain-containing protein [Pendulispora albinea]|uniref:Beta-ketoacyl-[acyl-carrier-protein] synthase family protein n=1 Tax=Pendulispora albinea TaxID=2741071 RepID=A0ABZ2M9N2_9BACT
MTGPISITGIGLITSVGETRDATWSALMRGERGIFPIDLFDTTGQRAVLGGAVRHLTMDAAPKDQQGGAWSRSTLLALLAAREAMDQARIDPKRTRVGLVVGATTGGMFETEARLAELHVDPGAQEALLEMLAHPLTSTGDCLDEAIGPFWQIRTLSSACSSGANALVVAAHWLLSGRVDAVVAGGTDGLCRLTLSGFNALAAIDPEPCRPFDRRRRGLNLGEGAGFLVLERTPRALGRGAVPIAELAGWSLGAEAHHITNPEPSGLAAGRIIAEALRDAGVDPALIDYVNAHGTGTPLNDPMESAALGQALGAELARIPVSTCKGQIGHTLAAAGAIEAGITALAVQKQAVVPTAGLEEPDPACPLVHVAGVGRPMRVRAAISNSFGFGGMDSALVIVQPGLVPARARRGRKVVVTGASTLTPQGLRGTADASDVLGEKEAEPARAVTFDLASRLNLARARRLDRASRMMALVTERALGDSGALERSVRERMGVVVGSSFGTISASAAFMHRLFEKGPRFASPADFPNLVPSSPVGHVSIYLGVGGPVLATADLAASGESAWAQAIELIEGGEADVMAAGGYEEASSIVERRLAVLFQRATPGEPRIRARSEGAAAVIVEEREHARARGARVLGEVAQLLTWRAHDRSPLVPLEPPRTPERARVVVPRADPDVDALLAGSSWRNVAQQVCDRAGGEHDALGAMALAAAAAELGEGRTSDALVIGVTQGRGYALRLVAP